MSENHVTEERLERFSRMPEQLSQEEQEQITAHLSHCKLCEEHLQALERFYVDLKERMQEAPTDRDRALAEGLLHRKSGRLLPLRVC